MAGVDSNLPLQLAFVDLSLQPAHPLSFCVEHRDLVLHLDQRQAGYAPTQQLFEHSLELSDDHVDRVVERAEVQADELVVMAGAHLGCHLVGMHRLLVEQFEDREGEWRQELRLKLSLRHILNGVYEIGYTPSSSRNRAS